MHLVVLTQVVADYPGLVTAMCVAQSDSGIMRVAHWWLYIRPSDGHTYSPWVAVYSTFQKKLVITLKFSTVQTPAP